VRIALVASALWSGPVVAGQLVYVANGDGLVSVIDTDSDEVVKTIPIPFTSPSAQVSLLLSPSAQRLFVLLSDVDTTVPRAISTVHLGSQIPPIPGCGSAREPEAPLTAMRLAWSCVRW
jgi:YVTN family beta-propeller protein